ncbi:MAG: peptidase C25, partial [Flavobacteriaceae bacterium]
MKFKIYYCNFEISFYLNTLMPSRLRFLTMNRLLFCISLICSFIGHSQTQTFDIDWNGSIIMSTSNKATETPSFNQKNYNFSFENGLVFSGQWSTNGSIDETSAELTSIETVEISMADLKQLPLKTIPNGPKMKVANARSRNKTNGSVEIYPIFYSNGVLKKIIRFSIAYRMKPQLRSSSSSNFVSSSVLKSGSWYRFAVDTTGVHKLNKSFLNSLGINTSSINPKNIKIYGHGGKSLPLINSETLSNDLIENSIQVIGEDDSVFNNDDYILMYAIGPKKYNAENNSHINPYSDDAFYYLNISSGNGSRMSLAAEPNEATTEIFDSFHDYLFVEDDQYNIAKLGRRWFGHRFYVENVRVFDFNFPNLITTSPIKVKAYVAATAESNTSMKLKINGSEVDTFTFSAMDSQLLAAEDFFNGTFASSSDAISVEMSYNNSGNPSASAYLDYISIEAERSLTSLGTQFEFKHNDTAILSGTGAFTISNASSITQVWDITNPYEIQFYTNTDAEAQFEFKTNLGTLRTYQAVGTDFYQPRKTNNTSIENQDIKGTVFLDNQGQFK